MIARLYGAEDRIEDLLRRVAQQEARIAQLEQTVAQQWGGYGGGGGGSSATYWILSPGFAAAIGSWPTITPTTMTGVDVQVDSGAGMVPFLTNQTIRWFYKDAGLVNKLVKVERAANGIDWVAILDSCTAVYP